jgi:hypothetical protein
MLWMAPEIIAGQVFNESVDVFSYAMCLLEVVDCHLPSLALLTRGLTRSFARGFARSLAWHRAATRRGWRLPGRSCERLLCLVSLSLSLSLHWTCISLRWETLRGSMQGRAAGRATRKAADKAAALCRAQPTGPRRPISAR